MCKKPKLTQGQTNPLYKITNIPDALISPWFYRYSVDVFQPPVKTEPKIHSSGMSSSSSQSSGSINSLDSQSSCSSSCSITAAEQGPEEDKVDFFIGDTNIVRLLVQIDVA